jgi:putative DNA primase/helicase
VTARFLYREAFEFVPQFKLTLAANHAPHVRDDDEAMWRRILRVPFENVIPKEERDPKVKKVLRDPKTSGPAILAWAVRGCMEWQREGLGVPPAVEAATTEYRSNMDPLKDFLEEYCVVGPGIWCYTGALREAYEKWAQETGEHNLVKGREWGERLRAHGGVADKTTGGRRIWRGIALVSEPDGDGGGKVAESATEQNPSKPQENGRTVADSGSKIDNFGANPSRVGELPKVPPLSATPPLGSTGDAPRRLTEDEARKVQRLIREGTKPELARREVLGEPVGHPLACECEDCL